MISLAGKKKKKKKNKFKKKNNFFFFFTFYLRIINSFGETRKNVLQGPKFGFSFFEEKPVGNIITVIINDSDIYPLTIIITSI